MARLRSPAGRIPAALVALVAGLAVGVAGAARHSAFEVGPKLHSHGSFRVGASLTRPLRPGTSQAVDPRLSNRYRYSLAITRLTVAVVVDPVHARAGCDARRDFRSIAIPPRSLPFRLRARRTVRLSRLRVRALPRVAMVARPSNQDACKGARLTLKLRGRARRWGRR